MEFQTVKFLSLFLSAFISLSCATLDPEQKKFHDAAKEARDGNADFAFMQFSEYLREHPQTLHTKDIKFAIAEYHLNVKSYRQAIPLLDKYLIDYAGDPRAVIAKVLLYKALSEFKDDPWVAQNARETFFEKSVFLVFSESKVRRYKSLLNNDYEIIDYVDRVEVFRNGELFFKITP